MGNGRSGSLDSARRCLTEGHWEDGAMGPSGAPRSSGAGTGLDLLEPGHSTCCHPTSLPDGGGPRGLQSVGDALTLSLLTCRGRSAHLVPEGRTVPKVPRDEAVRTAARSPGPPGEKVRGLRALRAWGRPGGGAGQARPRGAGVHPDRVHRPAGPPHPCLGRS